MVKAIRGGGNSTSKQIAVRACLHTSRGELLKVAGEPPSAAAKQDQGNDGVTQASSNGINGPASAEFGQFLASIYKGTLGYTLH